MLYQDYQQAVQQAARLAERGDNAGAIEHFRRLLAATISDLDKAMMCLNLAIISATLGRQEDALAWYDRGHGYERFYSRCQLAERKAAYLAEIGRYRDSLAVYEALLPEPFLMEDEKERMRRNIAQLRGML